MLTYQFKFLLFRVQGNVKTLHVFPVLCPLFDSLSELDLLVRALLLKIVNLFAEFLNLVLQGVDSFRQGRCCDVIFRSVSDQTLHCRACLNFPGDNLGNLAALLVYDASMLSLLPSKSLTQFLSVGFALPNPFGVIGELGIPLAKVILKAGHAVVGVLTFLFQSGDTALTFLKGSRKLLCVILFFAKLLYKL